MRNNNKSSLKDIQGNEKYITQFYNENKAFFIHYILVHYSDLKREDAEDLYHESFLALYQNVVTGKLSTLTSSLSTYLLRIGINKTNDRFKLKENQTTDYLEDFDRVNMDINSEALDLEEQRMSQVYKAVERMESPCKEILFGYYYDKFSMETLAAKLGYKDASVVKASKYKCMRKIRIAITQNLTII